LVYGVIHALVDAVTVTTTYAVLTRHHVPREAGIFIVLMYDIIAFASQPMLGWIADRLGRTRQVAGLGIGLCLMGALLLPIDPYLSAVVAGVGNALFHLGGGVVSLSIRPGSAAGPGIFVGPGTLGLAFGIWCGRFSDAVPPLLLMGLAACLAVPILMPHPENVSQKNLPVRQDAPPMSLRIGATAALLLLLSILFRSLIGHSSSYACPKTTAILFGLAAGGCLGKMCGGLLSDALGWMKVSVVALLIGGPLIAFGGGNPIVIGVGAGLFQMTMPVSLVALASLMPNRPATAFGFNCLAFIGGALPVFLGALIPFYSPQSFLAVTVAAVLSVFFGLLLIKPRAVARF
jgi:FSR family fosmidomycin resistance protein-like MFS transporter